MNSGLYLNPQEIDRLKQQAERGDGKAAYRLSIYYSAYRGNPVLGRQWERKAADLGDPRAQWGIGHRLLEYEDDPQAAKPWLEKAAAQGNEKAERLLKRHFENEG